MRLKVAEDELLPVDTEKEACTNLIVILLKNKSTQLAVVEKPLKQIGIADLAILVSESQIISEALLYG